MYVEGRNKIVKQNRPGGRRKPLLLSSTVFLHVLSLELHFFPACVAQPAVASNYDPIPSVADSDSERQGNQPVYRYNSPLENESAVALEARSADDRAGNAGYNLAIK